MSHVCKLISVLFFLLCVCAARELCMGQGEGVGEKEQAEKPKQTWSVLQLLQEIMSTVIPVCDAQEHLQAYLYYQEYNSSYPFSLVLEKHCK